MFFDEELVKTRENTILVGLNTLYSQYENLSEEEIAKIPFSELVSVSNQLFFAIGESRPNFCSHLSLQTDSSYCASSYHGYSCRDGIDDENPILSKINSIIHHLNLPTTPYNRALTDLYDMNSAKNSLNNYF